MAVLSLIQSPEEMMGGFIGVQHLEGRGEHHDSRVGPPSRGNRSGRTAIALVLRHSRNLLLLRWMRIVRDGFSPLNRMLKKSASCVLASLRGSTYGAEYDSPLRSLRPCWTAILSILCDSSVWPQNSVSATPMRLKKSFP